MADRLTTGYQTGLIRLRDQLATAVGRLWDGLDSIDQRNVDPFIRRTVPLVTAAQRTAVGFTSAYLAARLGVPRAPVNLDAVTGAAARGGTPPAEVYRRPFVTVWTGLARGTPFLVAAAAGRARLVTTVHTDVQLATRSAASAILQSDSRVSGYRRVPDANACELCLQASEQIYGRGDLMPCHPGCMCTVDPVMSGRDPGPSEQPTDPEHQPVVHQHGELGPVLANAGEHFDTGP